MKQLIDELELEGSTPLAEAGMTIAGNAKMFNLLFNNIYPNIVKATTRELIANAWDSMVEKGNLKTQAIDIHLPNTFEPWFSVRDYGTSMDHTFMLTRYTKAGDSTKDDSNDFAGMLGIGRLTPLGITNVYTVQCWQNGRTRIYDVKRGKDGAPSISFQFEDESDEPDGVLVQVSVQKDSFTSFKENTFNVVSGFDTPIRIDGKDLKVDDRVPDYFGPDWKLFYKTAYSSEPRLRMGCISYPIRKEFFPDTPEIRKFMNEYHNLLRQDVLLDFPIGSFGVTGSREDIKYDEDAVKKIMEKLLEVHNGVMAEYNEKSKDFKCLTDFAVYVATVRSKIEAIVGRVKFTWRGKVVENDAWRSKDYKLTYDKARFKLSPMYIYGYHSDRFSGKWNSEAITRAKLSHIFLISEGKTVKLRERIKDFCNSKKMNESTVMLLQAKPEDLEGFAFKKILSFFGYPEVVDMEAVSPYIRPKVERTKSEGLMLPTNGMVGSWLGTDALVDFSKSVHYIIKKHANWHLNGLTNSMVQSYIDLKLSNKTVHVVTPKMFEYLEKKAKASKTKLINVVELATEHVNKIKSDPVIVENIAQYTAYSSQWRKMPLWVMVGRAKADLVNYNFKNHIERNFYEAGDGLAEVTARIAELELEKEEFLKKYPLLDFVDVYYNNDETMKNYILSYIESIDNMEKKNV